MAKYTFGFLTAERLDREACRAEAIAKVEIEEARTRTVDWTVELVETDAHRAAGEFCFVIRTPE